MNRGHWQAAGILLTVYVLGAVTGVGLLTAWHGRQRQSFARLGLGPRGERPLLALMRRLDLSSAQRQAIEAILEQHAPTRRAIMQDMMAQCGQGLAKEKVSMDGEIRAVLNPDQRKRFDELANHQGEFWFGPGGVLHGAHRGRALPASDDAGVPSSQR